MNRLDSVEDLEVARQRSHAEPIVLYKHSSTCGASTMARMEVARFHKAENIPVYEVVVQRARHISNEIERRYGVRHESPQVIVLYRDAPRFDTSHGRVRADTLRDAVAALDSTETTQ